MDKDLFDILSAKDWENVDIHIGEVVTPDDEWEPMGAYPMPSVTGLRDWDFHLLNRYQNFYAPLCDMCCLCTFGKCDLTGNKKGACGLTMESQQGRIVLIAVLIGTACHAGHARHLLNHLIKEFGADHPIDVGPQVAVEAPLTRTITGIKPETLGDFKKVLEYAEEEITQMMAAIHTGQEGAAVDFESKSLHSGMIDNLVMEVADVIQISCYGMPKGDPDTPLVEVGLAVLDQSKPIVLMIGHNVAPGVELIDYLEDNGVRDKVDVGAICCTAHDLTRYDPKAKIVGAIGRQLKYVRSGLADVIMVDEQCVRADMLDEAGKTNTPVIATNEKIMYGLVNRTADPASEIVKDLVEGKVVGVAILTPDKAGEVAARVAMEVFEKRRKKLNVLSDKELKKFYAECTQCGNCTIACPNSLEVGDAMEAAEGGDLLPMEALFDQCISCARCEQDCPKDIPVLDVITATGRKAFAEEKGMVRSGRGPIWDTEIRNVGSPLVLGTIPGIIAIVGCGNYPQGTRDVYDIAKEFLERKYIVVVSGCSAMDIGLYKDDEGKTLYEKFPGDFDGGGLVNVGSCVANAHILGAAMKVANIFARRPLRGNYDEIADYILNRLGAVGLAWGAMSQKAASIATGVNRLGIPVVLGPHGAKYRRAFLGRKDKPEMWEVFNASDGSRQQIEPAPEHMLFAAETKEECIVMMARLCMRPSDNFLGRQIKMTHYLDLCQKYLGGYPDDWHVFIRSEADIPLANKEELLKLLEKEQGWKIDWKTKKIISGPLRKHVMSFSPTNLERLVRKPKEGT
jgi:acetyl-CoA decarbonylase/synthase complex subunit alpha